MTQERAKHYRSPLEVRQTRADFDESCSITLVDFGSLVGVYGFPDTDEVRCQLVTAGSRCNQPHKNGWIAKRKDGAEGYIGRLCARKHFNADVYFASEARRVDREIEIDQLVERLSVLLSDASLLDSIADARGRQSASRARIRAIREEIPQDIWKRLQDMRKTGNRVVQIEVRYVEKDERGKDRYSWIVDNLGVVSGLGALDLDRMRVIMNQLEAAEDSRKHAHPNRDEPRQDLRRWAESLEAVSRIAVELGEIEGELELFLQPANLRLLAYVARNQDVRVKAAGFVLSQDSQSENPNLESGTVLKSWDDEIRRAKGNRDFRLS
jgi:hypothetical protein